MESMRIKFDVMMEMVQSFMLTPYRWGGDDFSGVDCSGLVVECLQACGMIPRKSDYNAHGMWTLFHKLEIADPKIGALVFWFNAAGRAVHVGICRDQLHYYGAEGGGSRTKTEQDAIDQNAFVTIRPLSSRGGFARYVYLF